MVTIGALWIPILVSAVLVFIASFLAWVVSPHHKSDWKKLPDEEAVRAAMNEEKVEPGQYMVPYAADQSSMQDEAYLSKCSEGCAETIDGPTARSPRRKKPAAWWGFSP